ncbi:transmembrane amino acid transporter protein-domain-containing protein [Gaertneriomyces semiglobifer]|nr:transmembrane amino acid transporter protein-domain-containing protein [Gaertneriomyces semiglobifer]
MLSPESPEGSRAPPSSPERESRLTSTSSTTRRASASNRSTYSRRTRIFSESPDENDWETFGGRRGRPVSWFGSWGTFLGKVVGRLRDEGLVETMEGSNYEEEADGFVLPEDMIEENEEEEEVDVEDSEGEETMLLPKTPGAYHPLPSSSSQQTVTNYINLLIGISILSLPLMLSLTGWIVGVGILIACGFVASTTARLLAKCMDVRDLHLPSAILGTGIHPRRQPGLAMTYADVGYQAFGTPGRHFITTMTVLELVVACTGLIIVSADSIAAVFPEWNEVVIKCVCVAVVVPVTFYGNVRWLSWISALGIMTIVCLIGVVLYDGLTKNDKPGSLWEGEETRDWPKGWAQTGLAMGIAFAGFDGHAVIPSLYRDMLKPTEFPRCVNKTYAVVTVVYLSVAAVGYRMFGEGVLSEITLNLAQIPSYNKTLTQMTLWFLAINPLTKYSLAVRPVNKAVGDMLSISHNSYPSYILRIVISLGVLGLSIALPSFHRVIGLLGSVFSGTVAIIFPLLCFWRLFGLRLKALEVVGIVLGVALGMAVVVGGVLSLVDKEIV